MSKGFVQRLRGLFLDLPEQAGLAAVRDVSGPGAAGGDAPGRDKNPGGQAERFKFADLGDPAMAALFELCASPAAVSRRERLSPQKPARKGLDEGEVAGSRSEPIPSAAVLAEREAEQVDLPEALVRLTLILKDPAGRLAEAVDIIGDDPDLCARLLTLVNSAFYRRLMQSSRSTAQTRQATLARAVSVVGAKQLATLALGVAVMHSFKNVPRYLIDTRVFWKHSIACGVFARALAGETGEADEERFFTAGLLHDIGRLVLYKQLPLASRRALSRAAGEGITLTAAERAVFGCDHAELGGLMLAKWDYPPALAALVRWHHQPSRSGAPKAAALVMAADLIAGALEIGSSGERLVPEADRTAWEGLALTPDIVARVVDRADAELEETFRCLIG
jgi:putative nucleotidyltransferase with HDIG domain